MEQQDQLRAVKLQQLRTDIQEGLGSGEPAPWMPKENKQVGRMRKALRHAASQGAQEVAVIGLHPRAKADNWTKSESSSPITESPRPMRSLT